MYLRLKKQSVLFSTQFLLVVLFPIVGSAQGNGRLEGRVALQSSGHPIHYATVMVVELSQTTETDSDGRYALELPPGSYSVIAFASSMNAPKQLVEIQSGETRTLDFQLEISPLQHEITVTAKGIQQPAFEAVHSVTSLGVAGLAARQAPGLGDLLEGLPGVAKRSFGPGSSRPVIRGFDGDRVLVMQDGVRIGSLASQSGDHGEPLDSTSLEHVEVLRGPATLLYGSNAIGGVVNAISHHHEIHTQPHQGTRARVSTVVGSTNGHLGGSFTAEHGVRDWIFWIGGGGQRTNDYDTPVGKVENSQSRISNGNTGLGFFGERAFASLEYLFNEGRYGIPFAAEFHAHGHEEEDHGEDEDDADGHEDEEELDAVSVAFRRHNIRFTGGLRNLGSWIEAFKLSLNHSSWGHDELEIFHGGDPIQVGTAFQNDQFVYRGVFQQSLRDVHSGSFGFWGMARDYQATGEEALSPPVDQKAFAVFVLQEFDFDRLRLQLGGRLEHTRFHPMGPQLRHRDHEEGHEGEEEDHEGGEEKGEAELVTLPDRDFTGGSAGIGARFKLWERGALVAHFTSSYRAPALAELYNFGPHVGNLAFEVGNPNLERERSNGFDLSLRQSGDRVRAEAHFFYYDIDQFVFLAPSGETVDDLIEADFFQADSRFVGTELNLDVPLHTSVWLNLGLDMVAAELTASGESLPRIPPLRGRFGLDWRYRGFSLRPELVVAADRSNIFSNETPTSGYTVLNLGAFYTLPRQHHIHNFALNVFNVEDRLYRNHVSFIKDLAPEIGRGVSFAYTVEFF